MKKTLFLLLGLLIGTQASVAQDDSIIDAIVKEANENSQLEMLGHQLMDVIGPRLVGTPQMKKANDWAVNTYSGWGIAAKNEQWGEWRGWERGITHIDMVYPRVQTLEGTQLAWSPSTSSKGITGDLVVLPDVKDSLDFQKWLPSIKGKMVMISMKEPTGRPDYNWEEFATEESFEKMKEERDAQTEAWRENIARTGYSSRSIIAALEEAGASAIVSSRGLEDLE